MSLPQGKADRKRVPIATGVVDYFPDGLAEVAKVSFVGNEQHNPGEPLHWSRGKSDDHADCAMRHFVERGKIDDDGTRHTAKAVWRMLAILQLECEEADEEELAMLTEYAEVQTRQMNSPPSISNPIQRTEELT